MVEKRLCGVSQGWEKQSGFQKFRHSNVKRQPVESLFQFVVANQRPEPTFWPPFRNGIFLNECGAMRTAFEQR